jgi:hypothetical protein
MTVIAGDHIELLETTGSWHRGRNLFTQSTGIFPAAYGIPAGTKLTTSNDLLYSEASLTLSFALEAVIDPPPWAEMSKIVDRIFDVMTQVTLCVANSALDEITAARLTLASSLDNLRQAINFPTRERSASGALATLSTWGRAAKDPRDSDSGSKSLEYVVLHCLVEVYGPKKPLICRFYLWEQLQGRLLSTPASLTAMEGSVFNLVFDELEMRQIQSDADGKLDNIWLVIYSYDYAPASDGCSEEISLISCAVQRLPKAHGGRRSGAYFGKCKVYDIQSWTSSNKSALFALHTQLTSQQAFVAGDKQLQRFGPTFTLRFTPFHGVRDEIIKGQGMRGAIIVMPAQLPLQISPRLRRSFLTTTVCRVELDTRPSKLRVSVRLMDTAKQGFPACIENITGLSHDQCVWKGQVFAGRAVADFAETFGIDLALTDSPLCSLFLVVQVDKGGKSEKRLTPYAYGLIRLASDIGALTTQLEGSVQLFEFKPRGWTIEPSDYALFPKSRPVGTIGYQLIIATTLVTADEYLFRMMNLKAYRQDIEMALDKFMFSGLSEWSKFAPELMLSHCRIITTNERHARRAFQSLTAMFGELLSKAGSDYAQVLDEFIQTGLADAYLPALGDALLPFIVEILTGDNSSQDYRTLLKTVPYLVRLVLRSTALEPTPTRKQSVNELFAKLCEIVAQVEEDKLKNSFVMANQRLVLQHFARVVSDLALIFTPQETAALVLQFVRAIRAGNESIDRAKLGVLAQLIPIPALWTMETAPQMTALYAAEVKQALERAHARAEAEVLRILTSLFFSQSAVLVGWIPMLAPMASDRQILRLLLEIAFYFPLRFPRRVMLDLLGNSLRPTHEALFVVAHWFCTRADTLLRKPKEKLHDVLRHVVVLGASLGYANKDDIDYVINEQVYGLSSGLRVVAELFESLPVGLRSDRTLIKRVVEFAMCVDSPALARVYRAIVTADAVVGRRESLRALFGLMQNAGFGALREFFKSEDPMLQQTAECIHDLQLLPEDIGYESERAEAICRLLAIASHAEDHHITMTLVRMLLAVHQLCGNGAESAFALRELLMLIPCDDAETSGPLFGFRSTTGRGLHAEVIVKMTELLIDDGYQEYALPYLDQLVGTCVRPFRHVELMPQIATLRSRIFTSIVNGNRAFSRYFWVTFYGDNFDKYFKERSFVYRRPEKCGDGFADEIRSKFHHAEVGTERPPEGATAAYVRVIEVFRSSPEEVKDYLAMPPYAGPKYICEFKQQDQVTVFRADRPVLPDSTITDLVQEFVFVTETFPTKLRHVPVDLKKTVTRTLTAVENALCSVARLNYRVESNLFWYSNDLNEDIQIIGRIDEAITEVAQGLTLPQTPDSGMLLSYIDTFMTEEYVRCHPWTKQSVVKLRVMIQEQIDLIPRVLKVTPPAVQVKDQMALLTAIATCTEKAYQTYKLAKKLEIFGFKAAVGGK